MADDEPKLIEPRATKLFAIGDLADWSIEKRMTLNALYPPEQRDMAAPEPKKGKTE